MEAGEERVLEGRPQPGRSLRFGEQAGKRLRDAPRQTQPLDEGRGRARTTVLAHPLPRQGDAGARRAELREEVALFVEAALLARHVGEHRLEGAAQRVGKQRILADAAGEDVAIHAEQEEMVEGMGAGLGDAQHGHPASGAPEALGLGAPQRALEQQDRLGAREIEVAWHFQGEGLEGARERAARCARRLPAQPAQGECLQPLAAQGEGRPLLPRNEQRCDLARLGDGRREALDGHLAAPQIGARAATLLALLLTRSVGGSRAQALPHREREILLAAEARRDVEARDVAETPRAEGVEGDAEIDRLAPGPARPPAGPRGEPAVDRRRRAVLQQIEKRAQDARTGLAEERRARGPRVRDGQTSQVAAQRYGVGRELPRHDADALGGRARVEAGAHAVGDAACFGVGAGGLEQAELGGGRRGLGLPGLRRPARQARAEGRGELGAGVAPQRVGGIGRVIEQDPGAVGAHERFEERARGSRHVGEAVHVHRARREELGPIGEELGGAGQGEGAVSAAPAFEGAGRARRHLHERRGARAERLRPGALGEGVEVTRQVRRLEAGVEEILDGGDHGGVAVSQLLEGLAKSRLPPRLAANQEPEQGIGAGHGLLRSLQHLAGQPAERLHHHPQDRAAGAPHEARGHVLAEAPRRDHDAKRTREERLQAGRVAARAAELRGEGGDAGEERLLRRQRAALDLDCRPRGPLHRRSIPPRRDGSGHGGAPLRRARARHGATAAPASHGDARDQARRGRLST